MSAGLAQKIEAVNGPPRVSERAPREAPAPIGPPAGQAFTGVVRVRDGHDAALSAYLTNLGANIGTPTDIPFDALRTVHFFRWVVVRDTAQKPWLAFETNYDGPLEEHLGEIVREAPRAVHTIYGHCEGYPLAEAATLGPDAASRVVSYWRGQAVESRAFYRAMTGKTAERIRRESEIRDSIEGFVDDRRKASPGELTDPAVMYDAIVRHLESKGLLEDARAKQPPLPVSSLWPVVLRVLPFVPLALPLAPLAALVALSAYGVLRLKENADRQDDVTTEPPRIRELAEREDFQVQNQLTHLVDVKKGLLRAALLRGVLGLIDVLAKYQFNQGQLGGITTIHFARWVFIDGGKRLLFFSNYDGSWENYLGEFIDQASVGLTGVWSNTVGFPRTKNLVEKGATDEERFKSWTRNHQVPTQLWYSAYPDLTVFNIAQNARICEGLAVKPATTEALRTWLECI